MPCSSAVKANQDKFDNTKQKVHFRAFRGHFSCNFTYKKHIIYIDRRKPPQNALEYPIKRILYQ